MASKTREPNVGLRPVLTIDPRRQFGQVCIDSGRVPASAVAGCVAAGDSVDFTAENYGITRDQLLTACWWYVNECAKHNRRKWERQVEQAWGAWADEAALILGGHRPGPLADPPPVPRKGA